MDTIHYFDVRIVFDIHISILCAQGGRVGWIGWMDGWRR